MSIFPIRFLFTIVACFTLAFGSCWQAANAETAPGAGTGLVEKSSGEAAIGGDFTLTDQKGQEVKESSFRGKLMLVFFGYTNCPHECPMAAGSISVALQELGEKAAQVTPIFITVDPRTDTPKRMTEFFKSFDPRFVGLTGSKEQLAQASQAYKVYAQAVDGGRVNHSAYIYLMDRNGRFLAHFPHDAKPKEIADEVKKWVQ